MSLFHVYPRLAVSPSHARGVYVYDGHTRYLDLYGGHGVISIGHSHPHYVQMISNQLNKIGFYSNAVKIPAQEELARAIKRIASYTDYQLFLCNSGAEANENALKLASFHTGKKKFIAFKNSFHGRSAAALNVTDNKKISAPLNLDNFPVSFLDLNDIDAVKEHLDQGEVAAIIVEGIQGVGGLDMPTVEFLREAAYLCDQHGSLLILDEIQSGFGRSGKFFAHQYANIQPDIICMAKGMGNGFPIGGLLIRPTIKASYGLLGTTFGGNHLACVASLAVLEILETEKLMENAVLVGNYLVEELKDIPAIIKIKGKGLMLGIELAHSIKELRQKLIEHDKIFTGTSTNPNLLRILPPLCVSREEIAPFVDAIKKYLK